MNNYEKKKGKRKGIFSCFIKKLKNMNLVKAKEIANKHINIAYHINKSQKNIDFI